MALYTRILKKTDWLFEALLFFKTHFVIILALGLIAAFGRATQLGAFGPVSSSFHFLLEIIIQSARLLIFVYTLGFTNVKKGLSRIKKIVTTKAAWKENWHTACKKIKTEWPSLLTSFVIYLLIALVINKLIDYAAYQTCLYYKLKTNEIISNQASEWVIILFFKNISVIPFTLVFNALFLLWITNKISLVSEN